MPTWSNSLAMGVSMMPGWMELTRTPWGASSWDAPLVMPRTAHLLAPYANAMPVPRNPAMEEMLMMEPLPWSIMIGAMACIPRKTPVWLMAIIESHRARSVSANPAIRKMPALLMRTSTRPLSLVICLTTASQVSASVTSCSMKVAPILLLTAVPSSTRTSVR